jgi:hypothetical protein
VGQPSADLSETHYSRSATINSSLYIQGSVAGRSTRMLVNTGSAVSLVREDVWREAHPGACVDQLEPADCPVVTANGEPLDLLGRTGVLLTVGGVQEHHPVLIARQLTQDCLLVADFLLKHRCVLDLQSGTLKAGGKWKGLISPMPHPVLPQCAI